jgi:hypothetical protein
MYSSFSSLMANFSLKAFRTEILPLSSTIVLATTLALRNGCKVAEKLEVDEKLPKHALRLSDILDVAVEKEFQGQQNRLENYRKWKL